MHGFWRDHGRGESPRWRRWREHLMRAHDHHHHHGRGRRGRGVGRLLAHGDLRFLILDLIAEQPRHGYEIIKAIEESVAGLYAPSPGVVYPTLTLLEELGWARETEAPSPEDKAGARKRYEATDEGRAALEANRATLQAIRARLEEARASRRRDVDPRIIEAAERLKRALALRAALRTMTEAEATAIADAIDAAARTVEEL